MIALRIRVYGKVQGVYYRQSTRAKALELGVTGFVCNEPDGSVYVEAEGGEAQMEALRDWCTRGPALARVERVEVEPAAVAGFTGFDIRR